MNEYNTSSFNEIWMGMVSSGQSPDKLVRDLERNLSPDSILTKLLDTSLDSIFHKYRSLFGEYTDLYQWIIGFDSHSNKIIKHIHLFKDSPDGMKFLDFLDKLRTRIINHIQSLINDAIIVGRMPPKGIVLYFSEDIENRFLVTYDARTGYPRISFIDRMQNVRSLFDLDEVGKLKSQRAKNIAKSFLQSGHKAVMHYGIITHVDRRRHFDVFGPSIDTLHLADILLSSEFVTSVKTILEIGVGSGHIICAAVKNINKLEYVDANDVNPFAILCTNENLRKIVNHDGNDQSPNDLTLSIGSFHKDKFQRGYDLVVCNPPYVTLPPDGSAEFESDYALATVGTSLIEETLEALPYLLRPGGRCLMMVSSSTLGFEKMLPVGLTMKPAQGERTIRVPFDVEAVNNNKRVLDYLVTNGGVERDGLMGQYTHCLKPFWIEVAK